VKRGCRLTTIEDMGCPNGERSIHTLFSGLLCNSLRSFKASGCAILRNYLGSSMCDRDLLVVQVQGVCIEIEPTTGFFLFSVVR
jgi:hypothetical protein